MIPKNKNISVLHPYMNKKGWAVKMMIYLSNLLVSEWNNVKIFTTSYDKVLFSQDINFEVVVSSKLQIAKKIRKSDYIIIWNSPMQFVWVFSKLIFRSGAKLIWWHHHYPWYYSENTNFLILIKRYFERLSLKFIDELVVNSNYLKNSLKKIYSRESKILSPIVEDTFIQNYSIKENCENKILFTYGRWVGWKNLEQVFDTYLYLKDKVSNLELRIWWEGEELEKYKERFKTDKNISFLWLLDNNLIISNLKESSIFLFPSKVDSFGMTALEAQTLGVPVISFDLPWINEIVINWETWFLAEDEKDFSEKSLTLITDDNLLKKFSKNSKKISTNYNQDNFLKQLEKIL